MGDGLTRMFQRFFDHAAPGEKPSIADLQRVALQADEPRVLILTVRQACLLWAVMTAAFDHGHMFDPESLEYDEMVGVYDELADIAGLNV